MADLVRGLEEQEYYHGFIRREEAENILRRVGDYLVRCELERGLPSTVQPRLTSTTCKYILCVLVETEPKKFTVAEWVLTTSEEQCEEKWRVGEDEKLVFDSLPLLIENYANPEKKLELPPVPVTKFTKSGKIPWIEQEDKPAPPPSTTVEKIRLKKCVRKPKWQLNPADVIMSTDPDQLLGAGNYGYVQRGQLNQNGTKIAVAIKVVEDKEALATRKNAKSPTNAVQKKGASKKSQYTLLADTLKEAAAMRNLSHPNVIKMYGVVVDRPPVMMVIELVNKGSLKSYISERAENKKIDEAEMHNFTLQAAWGLEYLHSKLVIHRDIAARNCLLHADDKEQLILKISDFGLSKLGKNYHLSKTTTTLGLPVKTMAPESFLNYMFNSATDVWSFGFLMYEIYSHGKQPLPDWNWAKLVEHYNINDKNDCPQELPEGDDFSEMGRRLMRGCWKYSSADRLTISNVCCILEKTTGLKPPVDVPLRKQNESKKKIIESMLRSVKPKEELTGSSEVVKQSREDAVKGSNESARGQSKKLAKKRTDRAKKVVPKECAKSTADAAVKRSKEGGNRFVKDAASQQAKKSLARTPKSPREKFKGSRELTKTQESKRKSLRVTSKAIRVAVEEEDAEVPSPGFFAQN